MVSPLFTSKALSLRSAFAKSFNYATRKSFASAASSSSSGASATRVSTLDNGLIVATESNARAPTATVGVWIDAGSRAENVERAGVAHFAERMCLKGTKKRSQQVLETEVENMGAQLRSYTTREHNAFFARTFKSDVSKAVGILADVIQNPTFDMQAVDRERAAIIKAAEHAAHVPEHVTMDHLYATAFQGNSFGRPVIAPKERLEAITRDDLAAFVSEHYTADRMVLAGAGDVDHDQLVAYAKEAFGGLKPSAVKRSNRTTPPAFVGSEVRLRDDTAPVAHIAFAVQAPGMSSNDYYTMLVMQAIIGSWDRSLGAASNLTSRLSHMTDRFHLCNSYMTFNEAVGDTGLFGMYFMTENLGQIDDLIHFAQKELTRLCISPTEGEVFRAKNQVQNALLQQLNATCNVAEDIGKQMVSTGKRYSGAEVAAILDRVTTKDVQRVGNEYIWDQEVAVVGAGPIEGLTDFTRVRGAMARNIW